MKQEEMVKPIVTVQESKPSELVRDDAKEETVDEIKPSDVKICSSTSDESEPSANAVEGVIKSAKESKKTGQAKQVKKMKQEEMIEQAETGKPIEIVQDSKPFELMTDVSDTKEKIMSEIKPVNEKTDSTTSDESQPSTNAVEAKEHKKTAPPKQVKKMKEDEMVKPIKTVKDSKPFKPKKYDAKEEIVVEIKPFDEKTPISTSDESEPSAVDGASRVVKSTKESKKSGPAKQVKKMKQVEMVKPIETVHVLKPSESITDVTDANEEIVTEFKPFDEKTYSTSDESESSTNAVEAKEHEKTAPPKQVKKMIEDEMVKSNETVHDSKPFKPKNYDAKEEIVAEFKPFDEKTSSTTSDESEPSVNAVEDASRVAKPAKESTKTGRAKQVKKMKQVEMVKPIETVHVLKPSEPITDVNDANKEIVAEIKPFEDKTQRTTSDESEPSANAVEDKEHKKTAPPKQVIKMKEDEMVKPTETVKDSKPTKPKIDDAKEDIVTKFKPFDEKTSSTTSDESEPSAKAGKVQLELQNQLKKVRKLDKQNKS
ncbi:hypothetical protein WMY93_020219 [Mugilogobius chulae]|uniref:Uncharacterized protein n=1 Tax=Mugilogobius chulae TaxID=88201 RepID=A0AAW0NT84_9GOBI